MVGKIRYLIERKFIKPDEILCISFTNKACESLENSIKKNYNYNIKVYTFHKLALEILKNNNYKICSSDLLEYVVNEYFYVIESDEDYKKIVKRILFKIDTPYKNILHSKELVYLKRIIVTYINLFKTNNHSLKDFLTFKGDKDLLRIIIDIYLLYEEELRSTNSIDFNDMITYAYENLKNGYIKKYKYIIVDEYQDTSYIRYLLLHGIINKTGAKIVCVGDDYQSIYRFNGCDINMFLNFKKYFGYSKILKLKNTYRNSQELINVCSKFILKNKRQLYKKLRSSKRLNRPIKICYGDDLKKLLEIVTSKYKSVLILGRNNFDICKYIELNRDGCIKYNGANIRYMTIHASKGLEEECVIIINLKDDVLGIPSKLKNDKILKSVNEINDYYPYEEERRLFYVALTRTKNEVYLLVDKRKPSIFVKELIRDSSKYIDYI